MQFEIFQFTIKLNLKLQTALYLSNTPASIKTFKNSL